MRNVEGCMIFRIVLWNPKINKKEESVLPDNNPFRNVNLRMTLRFARLSIMRNSETVE